MEAYDTLAMALPIMGLLAFSCAQIIAVLILRRRFISPQARSVIQRQLQIGLYFALLIFTGLWAYVFFICVRSVVRELVAGNWLPLPLFVGLLAIAFSCLITVSWFSIRYRTKNLERLSLEIRALSDGGASRNGVTVPIAHAPARERSLHEKARHAVLYLGAAEYRGTLERLQKASASSS